MNIVNLFSYEFMQYALIASLVIGLILPFVGIILYSRRMGFVADAIGHINLLGIAFAVFIGSIIDGITNISFAISLIVTILGAVLIEYLREKFENYKEVSIIIVYSIAVSTTMIFLSLSGGYNAGLFTMLFGNINAISSTELLTIVSLSIIILILMKFLFKKFLIVSLENSYVKMYGINYNVMRYLLIIIITIVIAVSIKLIGVLLVSSMLTLPLLSASRFSKTLKTTIINTIIITEVSFVLGIIIAYYIDISASSIIVIISLLIYVISLIFTKKNK